MNNKTAEFMAMYEQLTPRHKHNMRVFLESLLKAQEKKQEGEAVCPKD